MNAIYIKIDLHIVLQCFYYKSYRNKTINKNCLSNPLSN